MKVWLPPVDKNKEPGLWLTAFVHMNTISSLLWTIKWYPTEMSPIIIYKPYHSGCGLAYHTWGAVIYASACELHPWFRRHLIFLRVKALFCTLLEHCAALYSVCPSRHLSIVHATPLWQDRFWTPTWIAMEDSALPDHQRSILFPYYTTRLLCLKGRGSPWITKGKYLQ